MSERYNVPHDDPAYPWLDEFLCEYADGTMDAAARLAFEEYLRANPGLADYVRRLCCARELLCRHGCRVQAPRELQARLLEQLAEEFPALREACALQEPPPKQVVAPALTDRLATLASVSSAMIAMLIVGVLVGNALHPEQEQPVPPVAAAEEVRAEPLTPSPNRAALDRPASLLRFDPAPRPRPTAPYSAYPVLTGEYTPFMSSAVGYGPRLPARTPLVRQAARTP